MAAFPPQSRGYDPSTIRVRAFREYTQLLRYRQAAINGLITLFEYELDDVLNICPYSVRKIEKNSELFVSDLDELIGGYEAKHPRHKELHDIYEKFETELYLDGEPSRRTRKFLTEDVGLFQDLAAAFGKRVTNLDSLVDALKNKRKFIWYSAVIRKDLSVLVDFLVNHSDYINDQSLQFLFFKSGREFAEEVIIRYIDTETRYDKLGWRIVKYNTQFVKSLEILNAVYKKFPRNTVITLINGINGPFPYFERCMEITLEQKIDYGVDSILFNAAGSAYDDVFDYVMENYVNGDDLDESDLESILHSAVKGGNPKIYEALTKYPFLFKMNIRDLKGRIDLIEYIVQTDGEFYFSRLMIEALQNGIVSLVVQFLRAGGYIRVGSIVTLEEDEFSEYLDILQDPAVSKPGVDFADYVQKIKAEHDNQDENEESVSRLLGRTHRFGISDIDPESESESEDEPPNQVDPAVMTIANEFRNFLFHQIEDQIQQRYEVYGFSLSVIDKIMDDINGEENLDDNPYRNWMIFEPVVNLSRIFLIQTIGNYIHEMPEDEIKKFSLDVLLAAHDIIIGAWNAYAEEDETEDDVEGQDGDYAHSDDDLDDLREGDEDDEFVQRRNEFLDRDDSGGSGGYGTSRTRAAPAA